MSKESIADDKVKKQLGEDPVSRWRDTLLLSDDLDAQV